MSFGESPNDISCYYILTKKTIMSSILGVLSDSYSLSGIQALYSNPIFVQDSQTIIQNTSSYDRSRPNDEFIVGIPNKNGNNLSKSNIYTLMNNYNINALRDIVPYTKQAGSDTTTPFDPNSCLSPKERKRLVLKYSNTSTLRELTTREIRTMVDNLGIANRVCLANTKYNKS